MLRVLGYLCPKTLTSRHPFSLEMGFLYLDPEVDRVVKFGTPGYLGISAKVKNQHVTII